MKKWKSPASWGLVFYALFASCASEAASAEMFLPVVHLGDPKLPHSIELYWSPSCSQSAVAFKNSFLPAAVRSVNKNKIHLAAIMVPRSEADINASLVMMCGTKELFSDFSAKVMSERLKREMTAEDLLNIGRNYGVSAATVQECSTPDKRALLETLNNRLTKTFNQNQTPTWIIDGKPQPDIYFAWQFEAVLEKLGMKID